MGIMGKVLSQKEILQSLMGYGKSDLAQKNCKRCSGTGVASYKKGCKCYLCNEQDTIKVCGCIKVEMISSKLETSERTLKLRLKRWLEVCG